MKYNNYWNNKENCIKEAQKYKLISELQKHSYGCYISMKRNEWLYDILKPKNKPSNYWNNINNLVNEVLKYKTKKEFRKHCKSGYNAAIKNGSMKELEHLFAKEDKRYNDEENKNHIVYVYEIPDYNTCYVGQTTNLHYRDSSHRRGRKHKDGRITYDCLYKFCENNRIKIPIPIVKENKLNARESLIKEDYWVTYYKNNGWNVLNIAKTGEFSGSLGSSKKWTYDKCRDFCKNYRYKSELKKNNYQCYYTCYKNGWFDEFGILDKKPHKNGYWNDKDNCLSSAKNCKNKTEFTIKCQGAYKAALRNGWMEDINKLYIEL